MPSLYIRKPNVVKPFIMSTTASRALERASLVELLANDTSSSEELEVDSPVAAAAAALRKTRLARVARLDELELIIKEHEHRRRVRSPYRTRDRK